MATAEGPLGSILGGSQRIMLILLKSQTKSQYDRARIKQALAIQEVPLISVGFIEVSEYVAPNLWEIVQKYVHR